jgi:hypothetical protein
LLALQAMTPNALAKHFDCTRQGVSKHIHILVDCHLLRQEQDGNQIYYHLNPVKMKDVDEWLKPFRTLWDDRFDRLDKVLDKLKNKKK